MGGLHIKTLFEGINGVASMPSKHPILGNLDGDFSLVIGGPSGEDTALYRADADGTPVTDLPTSIAHTDDLTQSNLLAKGLPRNLMPGAWFKAGILPAGWVLLEEGPPIINTINGHSQTVSAPIGFVFNDKFYFEYAGVTLECPINTTEEIQRLPDMPARQVNTNTTFMAWAADIDSGKLHIMGNGNAAGGTNEHFLFDANTKTWTTLAALPALRRLGVGFSAYPMNSKVYYVSGTDESSVYDREVYAYDYVGDSWLQVADVPHDVTGGTQVVVPGSEWVYLVTDVGILKYHPVSDVWSNGYLGSTGVTSYNPAFYDSITNSIVVLTSNDLKVFDLDLDTYEQVDNVLPRSIGNSAFYDYGKGRIVLMDGTYSNETVEMLIYRSYLKIGKE